MTIVPKFLEGLADTKVGRRDLVGPYILVGLAAL